jgi:glycosyltransferase involved in cell wall biosynthesis
MRSLRNSADADNSDVVIACCRDESDIIRPFIDFYLEQGFDRVCLIDNGSQDDTVAQIAQHPAGRRVLLHCDPRTGYDLRLLEYYQKFVSLASRWVFFIDVDEFIVVPGGIKKFARLLPDEVTVLAMHTFEMIPGLDSTPDVASLLTTRRQTEIRAETKVVWQAGVATKIYCGKHAIEGSPIVLQRWEGLFVRHFHTRSEHQFRRKLHNRVETESLIASIPDAGDSVSIFSREERKRWIEDSAALLECGGWTREKERLALMAWTEDRIVSDWYRTWARWSLVSKGAQEIPRDRRSVLAL